MVRGIVDPAKADPSIYVGGGVARPLTHVIDRSGVIRETLVEGGTYEKFEALVTPLLAAR